jgi:acyl-CoA thioesterase
VTNRFDADTALEGADGRWRAQVKEHWFVQRGPNGGLVAALATRALTDIAGGDGRTPRSLSLHYLAPPEAGEIEVRAAVERAGRTTSFASLRVLQHDVTVAYGIGACSVWREGQPEWDVLERPDVLPPKGIASLQASEFPILSNYEMRPLGPPHIGTWMRSAEPRPADPILLAALTDAWMPSAFAHMDQPNFVPTIDLTIHWRAAPGVPAGEHPWVLGLFTTRLGAGGTWEEDGGLWSEDGVLLAQSRQLAIVRAPR